MNTKKRKQKPFRLFYIRANEGRRGILVRRVFEMPTPNPEDYPEEEWASDTKNHKKVYVRD
ncbi:hypothetical protein JXI42_07930 [bacterium]|nr:hypothetical protein [bacterium]